MESDEEREAIAIQRVAIACPGRGWGCGAGTITVLNRHEADHIARVEGMVAGEVDDILSVMQDIDNGILVVIDGKEHVWRRRRRRRWRGGGRRG